MKKIIIGTMLLTAGLLLTGCGSEPTEEVAKEFATAISNGNIEKTKSLAYNGAIQKIDGLQLKCNEDKVQEVESKIKEAKEKLRETLPKTIEDDFSNIVEQLNQDPNFKPVTEAFGAEKRLVLAEKVYPSVLEKVQALLSKNGSKIENQKLVEMYLSWSLIMDEAPIYMRKNREANLLRKVIQQSNMPISKECIDQYTDYGFIKDINTLEIKEISPDKAEVRLELINKNDASQKITVNLEKIKDEWKVVSL